MRVTKPEKVLAIILVVFAKLASHGQAIIDGIPAHQHHHPYFVVIVYGEGIQYDRWSQLRRSNDTIHACAGTVVRGAAHEPPVVVTAASCLMKGEGASTEDVWKRFYFICYDHFDSMIFSPEKIRHGFHGVEWLLKEDMKYFIPLNNFKLHFSDDPGKRFYENNLAFFHLSKTTKKLFADRGIEECAEEYSQKADHNSNMFLLGIGHDRNGPVKGAHKRRIVVASSEENCKSFISDASQLTDTVPICSEGVVLGEDDDGAPLLWEKKNSLGSATTCLYGVFSFSIHANQAVNNTGKSSNGEWTLDFYTKQSSYKFCRSEFGWKSWNIDWATISSPDYE